MQNSSHASDEIDLLQLCRSVWERKWLVASCIVIAVLMAAVYVFFIAQPRYAVSAHLDAPLASSLEGLNRGRETAGLTPYTPAQAFDAFTTSLSSDLAFQQFVRSVLQYPDGEPISTSKLNANNWRVKITPPDPKKRNLYKLSILASTPTQAQEDLALFLGIAQVDAQDTILDNAAHVVSTHILTLENAMATQRVIALKQRQDRIAQLHEALVVAEAIGQDKPQLNVARPSSPEGLSDYLEGRELYARGVRALTAELEVLEAREDDDPFIKDLRTHEARLNLLRAVSPDTHELLLYRVDGAVLNPESPEQPRKALILALAIVLGGMVGVFWALICGMLRTRRRA